MGIHIQQINQIEGGFLKSIDEGALRMVLDNMQKTQYSHPEKSTVRELASNCIDAIRERDLALAIITGKTTVEEHFVNLEGPEYKDSHFDHMYYDPQWLSDDPNVYITYKEGSTIEKDKLIIRDNGVGIWGKRLEGYFNIAFSTKRLSRFGLGRFGIGAKAALSTGVPYYVVTSRYNGKEIKFNVYSYQVEPVSPPFNMATGQQNPTVMVGGMQCPYTKTDQKNGLEIVLEIKKHNKQKYIDAVKSQLLYFDNIVFTTEQSNGVISRVDVAAKILYEDDIMILSENKMYSKPHILINKVNYGNIDFQELELEDKMGNISIKFKPEEVSLKPSREDVIWDDVTRVNIVNRFKQVQAASEVLLQKELNQTDFMKWIKSCVLVKNRINTEQSDSLIARLAKLVDLKGYVPLFKPDPQFKLDRTLFAGIKARKIFYKQERHGSSWQTKVMREQIGLDDLTGSLPVLVQQGDTSWIRDRYLLDNVFGDGFITIWLNETEVQKPVAGEQLTEEDVEKLYQSRKAALFNHAKDTAIDLKWFDPLDIDLSSLSKSNEKAEKVVDRVLQRWNSFNKHILASEGLQKYESFEVPDSYKNNQKQEENTDGEVVKKESEVQTQEARLSAEQRRKLSGKTILFTPRVNPYNSRDKNLYEWDKQEIEVSKIDEWENDEVFYSSDDNASLLQLAAFITRPDDEQLLSPRKWEEIKFSSNQSGPAAPYTETERHCSYTTAYDGADVRLIKVAKDRVKYYLDFKHIHRFFHQVTKNKVLTMSNALIRWNTARYIHQHLSQLQFLNHFHPFNEEMHRLYHSLRRYCTEHYREVASHAGKYKGIESVEYDDMIRHLDKVTELQVFVQEHRDDTEAIAKMVKSLFGTGLEGAVTDGCGIDMNMRDIVHKLLDYAEPIKTMLNQMPVLTGEVGCDEDGVILALPTMTEELETEIRNYIQFKQTGQ